MNSGGGGPVAVTAVDTRYAANEQVTALVGRSAELQIVARLVEYAREAGACLLVHGDAGVGKSALLDAAARQAATVGSAVVRAAGSELETDIAYAGIQQLTVQLRRELPRLPRTLRDDLLVATGFSGTRPVAASRVTEAVVALLRCATRTRPLLCIIDDAHWFDPSSAAVLNDLAVRPNPSRLGIVIAVRNTGSGQLPLPDLPDLRLGPLDEGAAAQLLSQRFPDASPRLRVRVQQQAAGNPLALLELPAIMRSWSLEADGPPDTGSIWDRLKMLFGDRLNALPADTTRLLLLAALDDQATLDVLGKASPEVAVADALRPAIAAGLLSVDESNQSVMFRHPLTGAAVIDRALGPERRDAHRALGEAMAGRADLTVRRAWHLARASLAPDEFVAELLETAGQALARRGDVADAVVTLVRAADLSTEEDTRACRFASAAYCSTNGDLDRASQLAAAASRGAGNPTAALGAAVARALVLLDRDGEVDAAHRLIRTALAGYPDRNQCQDPMLVNALHVLHSTCRYGERPELWSAYSEVIGELWPGSAPDVALTTAASSDPARASDDALAALAAAVGSLDSEADPAWVIKVGDAASHFDKTGECRVALRQLISAKQRDDAPGFAIQALLLLGMYDLACGWWPETRQKAQDAHALSVKHGYGLFARAAEYQLAILAAACGDQSSVARLTGQMTRWAIPRGANAVRSFVAHVRAAEAAGLGDFEAAYRHAASVSPAGTLASHVPMALAVPLYLVDAGLRTGRRAEAAAHAKALADADVAKLSPRLAMIQCACSAALSEGDAARRGFEGALAVPGAKNWAFDYAQVLLMYGTQLRRHQSVAAAREPLGQAAAAFERLGAVPWAARSRSELDATAPTRASGIGRHRGTLTPQEREVAQLASRGLSNRKIAERLFISHRTVSNHLYQAFPKLGVTSRAGLRDALASLDAAAKPGSHR